MPCSCFAYFFLVSLSSLLAVSYLFCCIHPTVLVALVLFNICIIECPYVSVGDRT